MADGSNGNGLELSTGVRVHLHPFIHQVGGSTLMFKFDADTICKPLLPKEYNFYKVVPESLKQFTARYKGSIDIECEVGTDGMCKFYAVLSADKVKTLKLNFANAVSCTEQRTQHNNVMEHDGLVASSHICKNYVDFLKERDFRVKRSGSIELDEDSLDCYDNPLSKLETGGRLNRRLAEMLETNEQRFILLENLVAGFNQPSILDLKMGTRTYGDEESDAKKQRKRRRAENSTSRRLGVRLHGMQKFNTVTGKYETVDKYAGLKLEVNEFKNLLVNFVYDGDRLRRELLPNIIQKLKQFYECVSQQNTFRFYSSSLLVIYDGDPHGSCSIGNPKVNIRAIDFAHTTYETSDVDKSLHKGPDEGYLLGIQTLINIFTSELEKEV